MKRSHFNALLASAAALVGLPITGKAATPLTRERAGELFVAEMERQNAAIYGFPVRAIVKWNKWKEWTEFDTRETYVEWKCRLAFVPSDSCAAWDGKQSFASVFYFDGHLQATTYPFRSFGLVALKEHESELIAAVAKGQSVDRPEGRMARRLVV